MYKVLIVDDSRAIREIEKKYLEDLGFEVLEAQDGMEALKILEENPDITIILLDWHMPVMNGYECLLRIRSNPKWANLKVMMVTTENQKKSVVEAIMAGANEYLMKPFDREMLEIKIKYLLKEV